MTSPTWYDVLDVSPDASADEIRAAWRAAIADLDPTDRRFAALNQAAEVLLDPERRAAYDAELAPPAPEPGPAAPAVVAPAAGRSRGVIPAWLLIALAAAVLIVAGVATYVYATQPSDRAVEDATSAAQSAAERAVVPILSYDAKHLDESRAAAEQYLTGSYRKEYDQLFDGIIEQNAPSTGTVLKAELVRSSIVRATEDRVQVFALVNQARTNNKQKTPQIYKNWVTITMEKVDGDWLVAGMDT
ncbi:DnaJ domain-containing protein [Nocardioides aquiterrae]|uniref:J domain-containing protein n=1 Tax=Nocardioides aquiterrae TaxID=203799 RepID=A0ABP4EZ34_9ACTN